jgi:hypothetical protein
MKTVMGKCTGHLSEMGKPEKDMEFWWRTSLKVIA